MKVEDDHVVEDSSDDGCGCDDDECDGSCDHLSVVSGSL